jgi:hypothetical protein
LLRLAEVVMGGGPARGASYRVELPNDRTVVLDGDFDDQVLARLLAVVDPC